MTISFEQLMEMPDKDAGISLEELEAMPDVEEASPVDDALARTTKNQWWWMGDEDEQPSEAAKKFTSFAVGMGEGLTNIPRGMEQMAAEAGVFGYGEKDLAELRTSQARMDELSDDPTYGGYKTAGEITGDVAAGVVVGGGVAAGLTKAGVKAGSAAALVGEGAIGGAVEQGLGYIEEDEDRVEKTLIGAGTGAVIGKVIDSAGKMVKHIGDKKAAGLMEDYSTEFARNYKAGMTDEQVEALMNPELVSRANGAASASGKELYKVGSEEEAEFLAKQTSSQVKMFDIPIFRKNKPKQGDTQVDKAGLAETWGGVISTRIKSISPEIFGRLRKYEYEVHTQQAQLQEEFQPWKDILNSLSNKGQEQVGFLLMNGKYGEAQKLITGELGKEAGREVTRVKARLVAIGKALRKAKVIKTPLDNYYPRHVSDFKEMDRRYGTADIVAKEIEKVKTRKKKTSLSREEVAQIYDKVYKNVRKPGTGGSKTGKERKIESVLAEDASMYANPVEALDAYLMNATQDIAKARFFGTDADAYSGSIDLSSSIGRLLATSGRKLSSSQQAELRGLLDARFGMGEVAPHAAIQHAKNVGYTILLGNPVSAATQLGDLGSSMFVNNIADATSSAVKNITGSNKFSVADLGIVDKVATEMHSQGWSHKLLDQSLKWSGFKHTDRLGKNTLINSSYKNWQKKVGTDKGVEKFRDKYGEVFGDEFDTLVDDLRAGRTTENVKLFLFNELSDVQPTTLSEMPQAYLQNPNGRVLYMLQTFMLKQVDLLRNTAVKQLRTGGQRGKGLWTAARYATLMGMMGATSNEVKGLLDGSITLEDDSSLLEKLAEGAGGVFGLNKYTMSEIERGEVGAIPSRLVEQPLIDLFARTGRDIYEGDPKAIKAIPVVGKVGYMWLGGGIEEAQERLNKQKGDKFATPIENTFGGRF